MKKIVLILTLALLILPSYSSAIPYTFSGGDFDDLDHPNYYSWGIYERFDSSGIVSASLTFSNIINLGGNPAMDVLYLNLLDNLGQQVGIFTGYDGDSNSNAFAGQGIVLAAVTTIPTDYPAVNYTYTFTEGQLNVLASFARDGYFALGIDPDCHFLNDGVTLTINTARVPEPMTILLVGLGLIGVGTYGRWRNKLRV